MDIRITLGQFDPIRVLTNAADGRAAGSNAALLTGATQAPSSPGSLGALSGPSRITDSLGDGSDKLLAAINAKQKGYTLEISELGKMHDAIASLGTTTENLLALTPQTSDQQVTTSLRGFVDQYNSWDKKFDADVAKGGILEDSMPANMARFSILRDVNSTFNGRGNDGLGKGMSELGIEVGKDGQIVFDEKKLGAALGSDRTAAMKTISNMAATLSDTTKMLDSDGKPLANRVGRLNDALGWIDDHKPAITAQAQRAINAYNAVAH